MQRFEFPMPDGALSVCHWRAHNKPVLHWAHANGFNGQTYAPLLAPLQARFDVYAWDARGHGHSSLPARAEKMTGWDIYRKDLEALIAHLADKVGAKIWLGGHSMGGCASVLLAARRPDLVAGLVLADPVVVSARGFYIARLMMALRGRDLAMMETAKRRRRNWPDKAALVDAYTGRAAFAGWQAGFLDAYLDGGLLALDSDGDNTVQLACDPLWEAANFKGPQLNVAREIKKLTVPFTLLIAETGSTTRMVAAFMKPKVDKKIAVVPDSTHFLPMEFPELIRDEICQRVFATSCAD